MFAQRVVSGGQFQVEISTQPVSPGQTCVVTNGTGTIGSSDVLGVAITCATNRYSLGGTVSGMQGSGLQLTNGYGARLTVDTNGSFVFPGSFAPDTLYGVDVERQPSGPVRCRVIDSTRSGYIREANVTSVVIECDRTKLPPSLQYCDLECPDAEPAVVKICPASRPDCEPSRSTRVYIRVDGHAISGGVVIFNGLNGTETVTLLSGIANAYPASIHTYHAPYIDLRSDLDVTLTFYNVAPTWGGVTNVDLQSTFTSNEDVDGMFYRHASYQPDVTIDSLLSQALSVVTTQRQMVDKTSEKIAAFFMPTEMVNSGEGNFSYGDGRVSINYGNPPYIQHMGGIMVTSIPRFAHEHAHELFNEIRPQHQVDSSCLNEGVADALGFVSGFLPEADFGPDGVRGINFETDGCGAATELHDIGNCPLWHVKRFNLLTPSFMRSLFHPQHTYAFNSCQLQELQTGNSLLVMFTEAAGGADVRPALDAAGIPHAATYQEALNALGW